FIFFQGISTFWPAPLVQLGLRDGRTILGEVTRRETFRPEERFYATLEGPWAGEVRAQVEAAGGVAKRELLRTGNFELTNTHFQWVSDVLIEHQDEPTWALLLERLSWGRFYGFPAQFLTDGKVVADTPEAIWNAFQELHGEVRERWQHRRDLEAQIGRVNDSLEDARLELRGIELRGGKDTPEWTAERRRLEVIQARADQSLAEIQPKIQAIVKQNNRHQLMLSTADGQTAQLALADIVRAVPANQLGFGGKLQVYLSRWWEFLTDDPREANSEGGVYPAIFGTVLMTIVGLFLAPMMGIPKMDPAAMLAGAMGGHLALGWAAHFMIGIVLALIYAAVASWLPGPPWLRGAWYGVAPWLMLELAVLPMMGMPLFAGSVVLAAASLV
ncbi:MAG: hypothetical protein B7Z73_18575, partial [Planctomycetia bacterium 21-64-5]